MPKLKLVIDTNIWIRAILTAGTGRHVVEYALAWTSVFYSQQMLDELYEKLDTRKLRLKVDPEVKKKLLGRIVKHAIKVDIDKIIAVCDDPDDDVFFACAKSVSADFLISADPHILNIPKYITTQTMHPKRFKELFLDVATPPGHH